MNYRNLVLILIGFIVVSTLCIVISKPKMHKVVMIYNSDYVVVPNNTVEVEEKNIPTIVQTPETVTTKAKVETVVEKKATTPAKTAVTKEVKKATTAPVVQKEVKKTAQPVVQKQQTVKVQPKQEVKTTTAPVTKPVQTVQKVETKPVEKVVETKPAQTQTTQKVLTAKEEEIAWNIWRSNLQNQIMKDVRLPIIPNGIIFKFTFDVDKYGRVSNVQTWSTTPGYTPYAVQFIAPVIRSYQGKSILNFPAGSARTTTKVSGGWRIATNTKYSTPGDYNDTEKVVK